MVTSTFHYRQMPDPPKLTIHKLIDVKGKEIDPYELHWNELEQVYWDGIFAGRNPLDWQVQETVGGEWVDATSDYAATAVLNHGVRARMA